MLGTGREEGEHLSYVPPDCKSSRPVQLWRSKLNELSDVNLLSPLRTLNFYWRTCLAAAFVVMVSFSMFAGPAKAHSGTSHSYCGHYTDSQYAGFIIVTWKHSHQRTNGDHIHHYRHYHRDTDTFHGEHRICGNCQGWECNPDTSWSLAHPEPVIPESVPDEDGIIYPVINSVFDNS